MIRITVCTLAFLFGLIVSATALSQTVYKIPFASRGNTIELGVTNASVSSVSGVIVTLSGLPSWVKAQSISRTIPTIPAKAESAVRFEFSISKDAPIGTEQAIAFDISTPGGERWQKKMKIIVAAPDHFTLSQNYPNPFNPETNIEYTLPRRERVRLIVYNLLGQEVKILVDRTEDAGFKTVRFDASTLPSGVYAYRLVAGNFTESKKMMFIR